jgi:DNA topoisomerase-1
MPKPLIIVESPTKARTISGFLGNEVVVESSMGHIRDLPRSAAEIPQRIRGESWARLGVNVDADFQPVYVVPRERADRVRRLKELLSEADTLYLATDEDREGESIAWHLTEILKPKIPVHRMVFHEITEGAIRAAFTNPRSIDQKLVAAQEARRVLDRLYGYEISPVLWRRIRQGLSAGRVQSVAVRIIVEREKERMKFRSAAYWDLEGRFATQADQAGFPARLIEVDGARVATGADFDAGGQPARDGVVVLNEARAGELRAGLTEAAFSVRSIERKPYRRSPYPPFRTSTLQQEAGRKLRYTSARTMSVAQRLYEAGYITYMRTDSTALSDAALVAARSQIASLYGRDYLPKQPRSYANKVKNAQEAHEAIRPSGETFRTPQQVAREVGRDEASLYELIWKRTIASQMTDALGETMIVRLVATSAGGENTVFGASGRVITFPGFLRAYVEGSDDPEAALDDQEQRLPSMQEGDPLSVLELAAVGHETKPPARFTEASLVRRLEELGVGRPSTYASIMSTIEDRGYVWKKGQALIPSFTAFSVVGLLEQNFPTLVDYAFTARMEDDLDLIADGKEETAPWLGRFYLGADGLRDQVSQRLETIDVKEVNSIAIGEDPSGRPIVVRVGRYGPYLERNGSRISVPDDMPPDELTVEKAGELLESEPAGDKILGTDPDTGLTVIARSGRFGPYVQLGEMQNDSKRRPKTASLFKSMQLDSVSLDQALLLLSLPRVMGVDPDTGVEIMTQNGRYGPYLSRGEDRRSLQDEEQIFTISLEQALVLLAKPPERRRGRSAAAAPGREVGTDPASGKPVTMRSGRFGPYVTDGEVNASLRSGDDPDGITIERAAELLAARRHRLASGETGAKPARRGKRKKA